MRLDLDPASPVPIYLQIVEQVRRLVALGALKPGEQLPTVRELASRARVNRNTVSRAIQELEREGIVWSRVGRGTFVADEAPRMSRAARDGELNVALDRLIVEAVSLGVPLEELAARMETRVRRFEKQRKGTKGSKGA